MMRKLQQNKGFTLVELTIAIALYSFLLLIVLGGFMGVFWIFNKVNTANKVQQDARTSIDVITRATRFSNQAQVLSDPNQANVSKVLCVSGADGNFRFYRAKIEGSENHAIYQQNVDTCSSSGNVNPEEVPSSGNTNLIKLTSDGVDVKSFDPTMLDNNSSVELKVDVASGPSVTPTTAIDRFESYVSFQTVVNVRSYRGL